MLISRMGARCRCLLLAGVGGMSTWVAAQTETPEPPEAGPAWKTRFNDPAFRQRVEHADGVPEALQELALPKAEEKAFYDWLEGQVRPPAQHKIECLLRAHFARQLKRPSEEIGAAYDLVLQAAPGLPQGWFGRAEHYAADTQKKEASAWAAEAAVQGMRRVNLASPHWQTQMSAAGSTDWLAHAVESGHVAEWVKAVAYAVEEAAPGLARPDAAQLMLNLLRHDTVRKQPLLCLALLQAVKSAQPQLVLAQPSQFVAVMRDLGAAGQPEVAREIARLLVFAAIPPPVPGGVPTADPGLSSAAQELHLGFQELLGLWEDAVPGRQSRPSAMQILQAALGEGEAARAFAEDCLAAAQTQPEKNENLITHALLAAALTQGVTLEQMELAATLTPESRARVLVRLTALAPEGSYPASASGLWIEAQALALATQLQKGVQRSLFEDFLHCLECLQRSGEPGRLRHVLAGAAAISTAPRLNDLDHWERYAGVVLACGDAELGQQLAAAWSSALDQSSEQKTHMLPLARAAILAGKNGGASFARMALSLWERHHAEMSTSALPPPGEAARVGEALVASDEMEGFSRFVQGLEKLQKHRLTATYALMTRELMEVRDLLEGKSGRRPEVEAWVRAAEGGSGPAAIEWQFVLPEVANNPERPIILTTGDRDGLTAVDRLRDARWWRAGTALPALARLGGKWRLDIQAGAHPRSSMRTIATVADAPARGSQQVSGLPVSGCLQVLLCQRDGGVLSAGPARPFSTLPPLHATGPEPVAAEEATELPCPDLATMAWPVSWRPEELQRWGRLIAPPMAVEEGEEYLLTEWLRQPISPVRLILLDGEQRPLGPVPVASAGWQAAPGIAQLPPNRVSGQHTQRFRPSDWAGDGDLVFLTDGRAGERRARFLGLVTREPRLKTLPRLQIRPFRAAREAEKVFRSAFPDLPELNDEHVGHLGFVAHSWHVTLASDRGIIAGKGALAGFDVTHVPWKPLVRAESELIEGNEWPMCFTQEHSMIIEPPWKSARTLGLRFVPFDARGERYAGCRRLELPLPTYSRGEISEWMDGAVLLVSSQDKEHPQPACAWVETDGRCHVVALPRPPLSGNPGLEVAWWGPGGTVFTLHEDGLLFHMEHRDGLRLLGVEPGSPDDMPEGGTPGRSQRKRSWRLERPDVLAHIDKKTGAVIRRFHLPKPCEGTPMAFEVRGYVVLFTTDHEIIRVNPPPLPGLRDDDE